MPTFVELNTYIVHYKYKGHKDMFIMSVKSTGVEMLKKGFKSAYPDRRIVSIAKSTYRKKK